MPTLKCALYGVRSAQLAGVSLFSFPSRPELRAKWLEVCRINNRDALQNEGVCSVHFTAGDFSSSTSRRLRLVHSAVPSVQLEQPGEPEHQMIGMPGPSSPLEAPPEASGEVAVAIETPLGASQPPLSDAQSAAKKRKLAARSHNERRVYLPLGTWHQLKAFAGHSMTLAEAVKVLLSTQRGQPSGSQFNTPTAVGTSPSTTRPSASPSAGRQSAIADMDKLESVDMEPVPQATSSHIPVGRPSVTPMAASAIPSSSRTTEPANNTDPWTPSHFPASDEEFCSEDEEAIEVTGEEPRVEQGDLSLPPSDSSWEKSGAMVCTQQLLDLLGMCSVLCSVCGNIACHTISRVSLSFLVTWTCRTCTTVVHRWYSSPRKGHANDLDVVFTAAIIMTGNHYSKVRRLFESMNFSMLSPSAYYRLAEKAVIPVVNKFFENTIMENIQCAAAMSPNGLVVAGRCQKDSPGLSAAYGTYTVMDTTTEKIVAQAVVSRQEVAFSSPRFEVEGARRCLAQLKDAGVSIREFVSEQDTGVKRLVCETTDCLFSFDTWHAGKILTADLRKAASRTHTRALMPWVTHIRNHFLWSVEHCEGSPDMLQKSLEMTLHHVCGVHRTILNACHHDDIEPADHPAYLEYDSPPHNALREVMLGDKLRRKLPFLVRYRHTRKLECFHGMALAYTPKRVFFGPSMFAARQRMAVIDHSVNCDRTALLEDDGSEKCSTVYNRAQGKFLLRSQRAAKSFAYTRDMMSAMLVKRP